MLNKLKSESEFSRNVLTLMTGTTIAQAIPIAISPILTRIYTPEDFGVLALFIAISSIFGSIANARYDLAIMLPRKDGDAINILALGFIITFLISLILLVIIILFNEYLTNILNNKEIGIWLYFVPITVFFMGLFNLLNYFNTRKKYYKDIANATIIKSIILAITQLSIGFVKSGASGLIGGQVLSQMFANIRLLKNIVKDKVLISKIKKVKIIALMKRYQDFPKFSMWAILANTLSIHLINILISSFYSITTLGFYSLVQRVLALPSILIGNSIGQVFFQQATKEKQASGKIINIFNSTIKKIFPIGIIFFGTLFMVVESLFAFIFGEEWRIAGEYSQVMVPLFFIRFIILPFMFIPSIFEKIKVDLYFQLGLLISYILAFISGQFMDLEFKSFLELMVFVVTIYYIMYMIFLNNMKYGEK